MRFCLTTFILITFVNQDVAQTPLGIYQNSTSTEFNVIDCFNTLNYTNIFKSDSVKSNSILKGYTIWRTVSLENKNNQQLFNSTNNCTQIGLFEIIKFGLFEKKLNAFASDNFNDTKNSHLTSKQLLKSVSYCDSNETTIFDSQGNEQKSMVVEKGYFLGKHIKSYILKENWFINSYSGKLEKKIIGLAPLVYNKKTEKIVPLFWLYFKEWQHLFEMFEAKNYVSENIITYKDIFINNYFISKISKENNLNDKAVNATNKKKDNLLESELIKEKINNQEADLFQH